jgi:uncharacterized membrane protein
MQDFTDLIKQMKQIAWTNRRIMIMNAIFLLILIIVSIFYDGSRKARDQSKENSEKLDRIITILTNK